MPDFLKVLSIDGGGIRGIIPATVLAEIERLIRKHRIITPPLSRQTLVTMCEDGTFETAGSAPTKLGWLVYEDSFLKWVKSLDSGLGK